ncbi:hypothetical protein ACPW5X_004139 [Citrobacter freundii]
MDEKITYEEMLEQLDQKGIRVTNGARRLYVALNNGVKAEVVASSIARPRTTTAISAIFSTCFMVISPFQLTLLSYHSIKKCNCERAFFIQKEVTL